MAEYIDRNNLLTEIDKLKLSPWFNRGKNQKADYQHCMYLERKEGVEVVTDLCIKEQPTIDVIERSTMEILCNEYLSKCYFCHECCAETYCISNSLRTENRDCVNNLITYFTKRNIGE